jgi:hypothetical protein
VLASVLLIGVVAACFVLVRNCSSLDNKTVTVKKNVPVVTKSDDAEETGTIKEEVKVQPVVKSAAPRPGVVRSAAPEKKKLSLDEIKGRYGKVEILSLYDGRSFTGAVTERGDDRIVFETERGPLVFEAKTVRDTRIIR